jgi:hypothetical protein
MVFQVESLTMSEAITSIFRWQDYIDIREGFARDQLYDPVIQAMDRIASTQDGRQLIQQAAKNPPTINFQFLNDQNQENMHRKITINIDGAEVYADTEKKYITLSAEHISNFHVHTEHGWQRVSFEGVLVHELYHLADTHFNSQTEQQLDNSENRAVMFTDAFMAKNFPGEPMRFASSNACLPENQTYGADELLTRAPNREEGLQSLRLQRDMAKLLEGKDIPRLHLPMRHETREAAFNATCPKVIPRQIEPKEFSGPR